MNKCIVFLSGLFVCVSAAFAMGERRGDGVAQDDQDDESVLFRDYSDEEWQALFEMWQRQTALRRRVREEPHNNEVLEDVGECDDAENRG